MGVSNVKGTATATLQPIQVHNEWATGPKFGINRQLNLKLLEIAAAIVHY